MNHSNYNWLLGLFLAMTISAQAQDSSNPPPQREGHRQGSPPSIEQVLADLDTNKDGKLSRKEVRGPLQRDFKKVDSNKDGFLDRKELEQVPRPPRPPRPAPNQ